MMQPSDLTQFPLFEELPDEELNWFIENSYDVTLKNGEFIFQEDGPADKVYVTIEGEVQISRMINDERVVLGTTPPGIIGGEVSLLNRLPSTVTARAIMSSRLRVLDEKQFRQLFGACPELGARILGIYSERNAGLAEIVSQQEKMAALGKLSAGLAHELNNPAAAARRASKILAEQLPTFQAATLKLSELGLNEIQLKSLIAFQHDAIVNASHVEPMSPLEMSDHEDEIGEWLEDQDVDDAWELAATFVAAGVMRTDLELLLENMPVSDVGKLITWVSHALNVASLLDEVQQSSARISELVSAVKSYTYMDQAPTQDINVHDGLNNTLTVLRHKLSNVNVVREFCSDMPTIPAKGGELNQVWTNVIDNAIDAMDGEGKLQIITRTEEDFVMVEIKDNGPGIPDDVLPHLFEPFFTTKDIGKGTGLGLDISYRIIKQHKGNVEVQSKPGETRFIFRLPVHPETIIDE